MKQFKIQFILPIFILYFVSCDKRDIDVTAPTIEVLSFVPEPVEDEICTMDAPVVFRLVGGDQLSFDVIFKDNVALSQYKVDIHNNFDCHGHGGGSVPAVLVPNVVNQTEDWTVLEINDIEGQSSSVMRTFDVPDNVTTGNYHYQIQVLDESGNDNPSANIYSLKINNPLDAVSPSINVEAPSVSSFSITKGEAINFIGQVTDDRSLSDGGNGILYLSYTDLSSGNTFITDAVFPFDENVELSYDFDFEYIVPQTLVEGNYRFSLGANDGVRNIAPFAFFEVAVSN